MVIRLHTHGGCPVRALVQGQRSIRPRFAALCGRRRHLQNCGCCEPSSRVCLRQPFDRLSHVVLCCSVVAMGRHRCDLGSVRRPLANPSLRYSHQRCDMLLVYICACSGLYAVIVDGKLGLAHGRIFITSPMGQVVYRTHQRSPCGAMIARTRSCAQHTRWRPRLPPITHSPLLRGGSGGVCWRPPELRVVAGAAWPSAPKGWGGALSEFGRPVRPFDLRIERRPSGAPVIV